MIMNTIHDINTLRYLTGLEAIRVYAEGDTFATPVEVEDYIAVTIRYNNGAIGTLEAACTLPGGDPKGAVNRIYGEKGQVILSRQPQVFVREAWEDVPGGEWRESPPVQGPRRPEGMMEKFADAVLSGGEPAVTGWDGRQALEIVVAAYQSAEKHQPVDLPI
jgi:predicted dehydrogenase